MTVKEVFSPGVPMPFSGSGGIWTVVAGGGSITGGYYRVNAGGVIRRDFDTTYTNAFFGMTLKVANLATGVQRLVFYTGSDVNAPQVTVAISTTGQILVYSAGTGGTLLATYGAQLVAGTEYNLEAQITVNATTGTVIVRLNGAVVISLTGVNTDPEAAGSVNGFCMSAFNGSIFDFKNYFWGDGSSGDASLFTARGGALYVLQLAADGVQKQWTPDTGDVHFSRVNDQAAVGPGSLVSGGADKYDTFPAGAPPAGNWVVKAVRGFYYLNPQGGAIAGSVFQPTVRRGAANYDWGSATTYPNPVFPAYRVSGGAVITDPSTNLDWVFSDIRDGIVEFGMRDRDTAALNGQVGQFSIVAFLVPTDAVGPIGVAYMGHGVRIAATPSGNRKRLFMVGERGNL